MKVTKEIANQVAAIVGGFYNAESRVVEKALVNGATIYGVAIQRENIAPVVYIPSETNLTLSEIASEIIDKYDEALNNLPNADFADELSNGNIDESKIEMRIFKASENIQMCKDRPHRFFLDLVVLYWYRLDENSSVAITNENAETCFRMTESELYDVALRNVKAESAVIYASVVVLSDKLYGAGYGATQILNTEVIDEIANDFGSNLFIIPSSIHDVILFPDANEDEQEEFMDQQVREVNEASLAPDEVLSDHVYYYNRLTNKVTMRKE